MNHEKTVVYYTSAKGEEWIVEYKANSYEAIVTCDGQEVWHFRTIPRTKTKHPNKTQALEIIRAAKKKAKQFA